MTDPASTDADLVTRHLAGDTTAMAEIYERYADPIHDFCLRSCRSAARAADAVQDTFVTAMERLDGLRDPSALRPWLYSIARNNIRRGSRDRDVPTDLDTLDLASDATESPERSTMRNETNELIEAALLGLDDRDRDAVLLTDRHGLTGAELADALGVRQDYAYTLLANARSRLERSFGAVFVLRSGLDRCDDARRIAQDGDQPLSPRLRKAIAGHIESCSECEETKRSGIRAERALAALPLVPAPAWIRSSLGLDAAAPSASTAAATVPARTGGSGAVAASSGTGLSVSTPILVTVVAVVAAIGLAVVALLSQGGDDLPGDAPAAAAPVTAGAGALPDPTSPTGPVDPVDPAASPTVPVSSLTVPTSPPSTVPSTTEPTEPVGATFCETAVDLREWGAANQGPASSDPSDVEAYFGELLPRLDTASETAPAEAQPDLGDYRDAIADLVAVLHPDWDIAEIPPDPGLADLRDRVEAQLIDLCP